MTIRLTLVAAGLLTAVLATAAQAASPLDDLIPPKPGTSACFTRVYDAVHLKAHPKQKTASIMIWLSYGKIMDGKLSPPDLGIGMTQRGDATPLFASGGCSWDEGINRTVKDEIMIPAYKKKVGISCMMLARPDVFDVSSAEEGGYLILDRGKDKDTLIVYLQDGLTMVKRADRNKQIGIDFGSDDRVFMLRRADAKACAAVENAVTEPEPAAPRR